MSSKLVIVESPAKAKTIEKYLGKEYSVVASMGHIRDLPKSNKAAIDIPGGFIPHYEIVKGKEETISNLKRKAKSVEEVILAPDPDREGEAIAWHIAQVLNEKGKAQSEKLKRVTFSEITEEAVKEAMGHPREIDQNLRVAQEARRVLDRLVGYDLSGLIWKKVRYGLSAGRVQSPALRIIMEREREIRAFTPEDFWVITADFKTKKNADLTLNCAEEPRDRKEVDRIVSEAERGVWFVENVTETETSRKPSAPFITSSLQATASTRLGYSPAQTMRLAQKLYEAGHITYMRTDSTNISKQALPQIASVVEREYGKNYLEMREYKGKVKNAQEAHEAIRPSHFNVKSAGASEQEKKLYQLIWRRAVASQMADARMLRTKITALIKDANIPEFIANGSRLTFDGWLKCDPAARGDDVELPKVAADEELKLVDIRDEAKQTQPSSRYTEAGLIKELEKRGIGRPSTYATILKTLEDRGYVNKEGRTLFPTDTGDVVSSFLEQNFADVISDNFTAEMENELDEIAEGKREYVATLKNFYTPFTKLVKEKSSAEKITNLGDADKKIKCPACGGAMVIKLGRSGKFLSCARFPDCSGARTIEGEEMKGPEETGEMCPECKEGKLVKRMGKYGEFVSCSRYPKCKFIQKDKEAERARSTGVKCPVCGKGEMTEKRGRFGTFYGCSNYPTCRNIIKSKPTGATCPQCGSLMMQGTKTIPERCSNKLCPNHQPHKLNAK